MHCTLYPIVYNNLYSIYKNNNNGKLKMGYHESDTGLPK